VLLVPVAPVIPHPARVKANVAAINIFARIVILLSVT
jgi:hypothetical protein